jgi:hypothetical protein
MQALLISAVFGFSKALLVKFLSTQAMKILLTHTIDIIVKSSKTDADDRLWADVRPIIDSLDEK